MGNPAMGKAAIHLQKGWRRRHGGLQGFLGSPKIWPRTLDLDAAHLQRELLEHTALSC